MPKAVLRTNLRWDRVLAALLVLLVGTLGVRHGLGTAMAGRATDFALRIDGENALVRGRAAIKLVQSAPDAEKRARARELARSALARDAGNVTALVALGLASDREAESAAAFAASDRLSRRDLITRLWMIERAVSEGEIKRALRHYDIALRTSRTAPSVLFPVLVSAITDDTLLPAIAETLLQRPRPLWGGLYLQHLAQSGPDTGRIATLFALLKRRDVSTGAAADTTLYARLIEGRRVGDAWKLYAADHAKEHRDGLRNGNFANQPAVPSPFDWQLSDGDFVTARLERISSGHGRLVFTTAVGEGGEIARQLVMLAPGSHGIEVGAARIDTADAPPPYLRVTCLASGAELARASLAPQGTSVARFRVPAGCDAQIVAIVAQAGSGSGAVEGALHSVRLLPAN